MVNTLVDASTNRRFLAIIEFHFGTKSSLKRLRFVYGAEVDEVDERNFGPRTVLQEFPEEVRRELGKAIFDLQKGEKLGMPLSRTMASVGPGVEELRLKD